MPDTIVVGEQRIKSMVLSFQRTWRRPPTEQEVESFIEDYIREEVFYRESMAMGLDKDDTLIRRRLRQKLEFVAEDMANAVEPSDQQLEEYLNVHRELYQQQRRATFKHVFLSRERHGEDLEADALTVLARLQDENERIDPTEIGDPTLLEHLQDDLRESEIDSHFGKDFGAQLVNQQTGVWSGPIESAYGLHLVMVLDKTESRLPQLEDIRDAVRRDWFAARRTSSREELYLALREKYKVIIEEPNLTVVEVAMAGSNL